MKKLLAIVMVLTLVLSMSVGVFAEGEEPSKVYVDSSIVTIDKELTLTNPRTVNPAETFNFTIGAGTGKRDNVTIPAPPFPSNTFPITIAQGATEGTADITLPRFTQVGVYTYEITETPGITAGMIYDSGIKNLVVTVINNPDGSGFLRVLTMTAKDKNDKPIKVDSFKNEYSAGDLTVKKVIAGNYSDPNDEFEITVTITLVGKTINATAIDWNTTNVTNTGSVYTAIYKEIKGDDSIIIKNLPYGVTYEVVETNSGVGYEVTYSNGLVGEHEVTTGSGTINLASQAVTITNTRNTNIETGINLDNLPYVLILVGAAAGLVAFTMKRRPSSDE